jgi:hypothetical protein
MYLVFKLKLEKLMKRVAERSNVETTEQTRELIGLRNRQARLESFLDQNASGSSIESGNSEVDADKIRNLRTELSHIERRIDELTANDKDVEHYIDEEPSLEGNSPKLNKNLAKALLILGLLLAVSSAAVLVALYMPNNMPTVINDIVTNLSPFYHDLILGCAYGAGALGLLGALYKGTEVYKGKPLSLVSNSEDLEQKPHSVVEQNDELLSSKTSTNKGVTRSIFQLFNQDKKGPPSVQKASPTSSLLLSPSNED